VADRFAREAGHRGCSGQVGFVEAGLAPDDFAQADRSAELPAVDRSALVVRLDGYLEPLDSVAADSFPDGYSVVAGFLPDGFHSGEHCSGMPDLPQDAHSRADRYPDDFLAASQVECLVRPSGEWRVFPAALVSPSSALSRR
jgi:hypothetical protein